MAEFEQKQRTKGMNDIYRGTTEERYNRHVPCECCYSCPPLTYHYTMDNYKPDYTDRLEHRSPYQHVPMEEGHNHYAYSIPRTITFDNATGTNSPRNSVIPVKDNCATPRSEFIPRRIPSCRSIDKDPNPEDVLFGRGGGTNRHPGNIYFRKLVAQYQSEYVIAKKLDKEPIAKEIVREIRRRGGQFLKFNESKSVWSEVGDKNAILKASQALREGAAKKVRETMMAVRSAHTSSPSSFY